MKVSDAIKRLSETYGNDEELFIVWWDKETADGYRYPDTEVTVPQWVSIVEQLDNDEYLFHAVNDTITELVNKIEVE
jgi:hypothetical protein